MFVLWKDDRHPVWITSTRLFGSPAAFRSCCALFRIGRSLCTREFIRICLRSGDRTLRRNGGDRQRLWMSGIPFATNCGTGFLKAFVMDQWIEFYAGGHGAGPVLWGTGFDR
jgi:hypothetical protein